MFELPRSSHDDRCACKRREDCRGRGCAADLARPSMYVSVCRTLNFVDDEPFKLNGERRQLRDVTVEALLVDASGLPCLESRKVMQFSAAGDAQMLDNTGTVGGSRVVQLANGRAWMAYKIKGDCIAGISADGVPPAFLTLKV